MVHVKVKDLGIKFSLDRKKDRSIKNLVLHPFREPKREFWAIRHVNLELKSGDILGITGPNGSGKSTLLRAITGIYKPDEGSIEIEGRVALLSIAAGFEKEMTGIENIYLSGSIFGLTRQEIHHLLTRIIKFADIGDFINQPVRTYSSGMVARLGFAVAIHLDPDILLIDEVMAVGDKEFRMKCTSNIENKFITKNKIIILVSHDPNLIKSLCNIKFEFDNYK
ncbi:MAG: ABC transporter ATP-binding protein [Nanoarchaeota archaeon]